MIKTLDKKALNVDSTFNWNEHTQYLTSSFKLLIFSQKYEKH